MLYCHYRLKSHYCHCCVKSYSHFRVNLCTVVLSMYIYRHEVEVLSNTRRPFVYTLNLSHVVVNWYCHCRIKSCYVILIVVCSRTIFSSLSCNRILAWSSSHTTVKLDNDIVVVVSVSVIRVSSCHTFTQLYCYSSSLQ